MPFARQGPRLRRRRLQAGWSQLALSIRARVSRWRLMLVEMGARELDPAELQRIERVPG